MSKTIQLPAASDLGLSTADVICKLPTQALHNQLHQLTETTRQTRENLESTELAALILCGAELEHQKKVNHGLPWKEWVKSNCEFSYMTATKYDRVLKAARAGQIEKLSPELLPEVAPSLMSQDQLRDTCRSIAGSLQGLGGIRQLYLKLEILKHGSNTLPDNRNLKGGHPEESRDIEEIFTTKLKPISQLFSKKSHLKLKPAQAQVLRELLQSYLDDLKLIL